MCCWKDSFLSNMNPRYFQMTFGLRMGPLKWLRSSGAGWRGHAIWKNNTLDFLCSMTSLNCSSKKEIILWLQKRDEFVFSKDFSWEIKSSSSTKERNETGIFRFFALFSKIWKIREKYNAERIGESTEPWPTPMSMQKKGEVKLFQKYCVFLPIK